MLSIQCYTWISELGDPSIVICIVIVNAISVIQRRQKQPSEVFYKKVVLTNFSKFTGKHLCQSLFFKRLYYRFFPVNFPKYAGPLYLQNTFGRMRLHLEPCQISIVEIFCGNSKSFTVFEKKQTITVYMLKEVLITHCQLYPFMEIFFMHCK